MIKIQILVFLMGLFLGFLIGAFLNMKTILVILLGLIISGCAANKNIEELQR